MKRVGSLFSQIWDRSNIATAFWRAARAKSDRSEVRCFRDSIDTNLNGLSFLLRSGQYCFGPYRSFEVRDTKSRTIHAPCFADRVVHHAIINVIGPVLERGAIAHSYACRCGRGQHAALATASRWTNRQSWYGKIDVRKFYDNVDHEILLQMLRRRFREQRLLSLLQRVVDSYSSAPGKGIPIGALTSQYFGNFYLDRFDHLMKSTGLVPRYIRYMDDVVIWSDHGKLKDIRHYAMEFLSVLKLAAKDRGQWNRCRQGVPFLGFTIYPNRIRLNKQGRKRLSRKSRLLEIQFRDGKLSSLEYQSRLASLFAHAEFADDVKWRNAVLNRRQSPEQ